MKRILIVNQKGGCGKSTLADLLMFEFEKSEIPASFYDLDGQGGVLHETYEHPHAKVAVIDTPGALQAEMADWFIHADLIVIPTKPTMLDLEPLKRTIEFATSAECPKIYIIMMWNRFKTAAAFEEWLKEETGNSQIFRIPQSEQVVQASAVGKSVIEYAPRSKVAAACREFVEYVNKLLKL